MYNYCANFVNLNTELKSVRQSQLLKGCEVYFRWSFFAEKIKKKEHIYQIICL